VILLRASGNPCREGTGQGPAGEDEHGWLGSLARQDGALHPGLRSPLEKPVEPPGRLHPAPVDLQESPFHHFRKDAESAMPDHK